MAFASPKAILAVLVTAQSKRAPEALHDFESKFIDLPTFLVEAWRTQDKSQVQPALCQCGHPRTYHKPYCHGGSERWDGRCECGDFKSPDPPPKGFFL